MSALNVNKSCAVAECSMENQFIKKLRGFGALSAQDVASLSAATARPSKISARHDLIREGDRPGPMFVILDGWACRYKILPNGTRQVLAFLMPGDACDLHISLLAEMDHSIQTITPSLVATIGRSEMTALLDERPSIARVLYTAQLIDEGTLRAWVTSMGRRSSTERVAHLMCELYLRARNTGIIGGGAFELPVSQLLLADALGMTAAHLNRVLKTLQASDAISLRRGKLVINDPTSLAQMAGFDENYLHRRLRVA
jgi:CRP-like cAMP-binding protein